MTARFTSTLHRLPCTRGRGGEAHGGRSRPARQRQLRRSSGPWDSAHISPLPPATGSDPDDVPVWPARADGAGRLSLVPVQRRIHGDAAACFAFAPPGVSASRCLTAVFKARSFPSDLVSQAREPSPARGGFTVRAVLGPFPEPPTRTADSGDGKGAIITIEESDLARETTGQQIVITAPCVWREACAVCRDGDPRAISSEWEGKGSVLING